MKEQLEKIRSEALAALNEAKDSAELDALRVRFLGKKGELTAVLKMMGKLSAEERPVMGQAANNVRAAIEEKLEETKTALKARALDARLDAEAIDVTIPGKPVELGHRHPMNKALDEAKDIFISMGFKILDGPEVELADYNFTRLNIAENHPSRDRSDTFYITEDESVLLRTQTSPMQIRAMDEIKQPPIRILAPGVPQGRGRRNAFPHVPPDRGSCHRQGHHDGGPEGDAGDAHQGDVWRGLGHPVPSAPLPVHRAEL